VSASADDVAMLVHVLREEIEQLLRADRNRALTRRPTAAKSLKPQAMRFAPVLIAERIAERTLKVDSG
jgi:hypothetical protein